MATRSTIAIERRDGTVRAVYCHWDGYLENNGQLLAAHYDEPETIEALVALGQISSLSPTVGTQHSFEDRDHGQTTFYGRDRGETNVGPRDFASYEDYLQNMQMEEYNYIWRGAWEVEYYATKGRYVSLTDALADEIVEEALAEDE